MTTRDQRHLRRIALLHQGLSKATSFGKGLSGARKCIEHLGYVQIDTLSVVERAHHHTLWTRVPGYQPQHLEKLIKKGEIFEYWFHAAAFLPMADYRFALPRMESVRRGESSWFASVDKKSEQMVLDRIRIDGALKARDFESKKEQAGSWWNWKPAKKALEKLFFQGDLMIASRSGMEKVYDLRERVLPSSVDTREPSLQDYAQYLVDSTFRAHGFSTLKQITHLRPGSPLRAAVADILEQRIGAGELQKFKLEKMQAIYGSPELLDRRTPASSAELRLLSPFDNAVIHRDRLRQLFDFDYRIECYTPAPKRQYGYFCLPILFGDRFVGRADCKADRAKRRFDILHLHIEAELSDPPSFFDAFAESVQRFMVFNACDSATIHRCSPKQWLKPLKQVMHNLAL